MDENGLKDWSTRAQEILDLPIALKSIEKGFVSDEKTQTEFLVAVIDMVCTRTALHEYFDLSDAQDNQVFEDIHVCAEALWARMRSVFETSETVHGPDQGFNMNLTASLLSEEDRAFFERLILWSFCRKVVLENFIDAERLEGIRNDMTDFISLAEGVRRQLVLLNITEK